jgi:uncharacterized alkaline shock family protein YloU
MKEVHEPIITIVMMCLQPFEEVVLEETITKVDQDDQGIVIFLTITLLSCENIVALCERLQQYIIEEIFTMTELIVRAVHIKVRRLVYAKNA